MRQRSFIVSIVVVLLLLLALTVGQRASLWRRLQAQVRSLQIEATSAQLEAAIEAASDDLRFDRDGIQAALDGISTRAPDIERLERERWGFERKLRAAQLRRPRARTDDERLEARIEIESLRELLADRQQQLESIRHDVRIARQALAATEQPLIELETRLEALRPGWIFRQPGGYLFDPDLHIRQLTTRSAGGEASRVDRCATCHLPPLVAEHDGEAFIVRFDSEEGPRWARHPRPQMSIGTEAPHALDDIGCVACHGGDGRAVDFAAAGHRPKDDQQREQWQRVWGWRPRAASRQILDGRLAQGTCRGCHGDEITSEMIAEVIADLPAIRAGARLAASLGCAGCHETPRPAELSPPPKAGPSLLHIARKTSRQRVLAILADPRQQYPNGWMPALWQDVEPPVAAVEQVAVVDYLWQQSQDVEWPEPPAGDVQRGRQLLDGLGCRACHLTESDQPSPASRDAETLDRRRGPSLIDAGSRMSPDWLFAWLRRPTQLRADTLMPNFRLSSDEAADLTAHLTAPSDTARASGVTISDGDGDGDSELRDRLTLEHLRTETTIEDADAQLAAMDTYERQLYLGRQTVLRYGCLGCHPIAGVEAPPPSGRSLVDLGDRLARRPDARIPATVHAATSDRSAPRYGLDEQQRGDLSAELLGWRPPPAVARPSAVGRQLIERHSCRACHVMQADVQADLQADLQADESVESTADQPAKELWPAGQAPPALDGEGARVRGEWLFAYLQDPGGQQIRPWLDARMPTFELTDRELDTIVRYFADRASVPVSSSSPPPADAATTALGQVVYQLLQCSRCHLGVGDEPPVDDPMATGAEASRESWTTLAPDYRLARGRLRADWVVDWILDPRRFDADTAMPGIFAVGSGDDEGSADSSYLIGTLGAPMFALQEQRLRRFFASEAALRQRLSEPEAVAEALRAHLWTLERDSSPP